MPPAPHDSPSRIAVVDDHNRFVRWEPRAVIHRDHLPHRSVHVMVFDPAGRLLVQRRHPQKLTYPNHWDSAVAGHVEEADYPAGFDDDLEQVYASVAARELEEELGVTAPLRPLGAFTPEPGVHYEHFRLFAAEHPGPFTLQPEEVVETRWVTRAELDDLHAVTGAPLTHLLVYLVGWLGERRLW